VGFDAGRSRDEAVIGELPVGEILAAAGHRAKARCE
jgi:hypothetical protein